MLAVLRLDGRPDWDAAALTAELAGFDKIAAVRILLTDQAQTSIETREKDMRKNDKSFAGLLLIEGLDEAAVQKCALASAHEPKVRAGRGRRTAAVPAVLWPAEATASGLNDHAAGRPVSSRLRSRNRRRASAS